MILNGNCLWAKVLGEPRESPFDNVRKNWSIDLILNDEAKDKAKKAGLAWKFKETDKGETYIRFKYYDKTVAGEETNGFSVIDNKGKAWDSKKLIGNGSEVNVKFRTWEGFGKKIQTTLEGVQVVKHVPYNQGDQEEFPIEEDLNDAIDDVI